MRRKPRPDRIRNAHRRFSLLAMAAAPAAMALAWMHPLPASASTTWDAGSGNWNTPGNWTDGVPGNGANALIDTSGASPVTVTYNYPGPAITLSSLFVDYTGSAAGGGNTLNISSDLSLNSGIEIIGANGSATVNQSNGTNTDTETNSNLDLGYLAGATGTYNLSASGSIGLQYEFIGESGNGTFNQSGGTNTVGVNLEVASYSGSSGVYSLSGSGSLTASEQYIGYGGNGTFNQSGGSNTITGSTGLIVGDQNGANGTYNLSGGTLAINSGSLTIGNQAGSTGTCSLSASGSLTAQNEDVGYNGNGTFNQTGGTNVVNTTNSSLALVVGDNSNGTYNLTGGALTMSGNGGNADLNLGIYSGSNGVFSLGGSGTLTSNFENIAEGAGTGTFYQTGGVNNASGISIANYATGSGLYSLSGNASLTVSLGETVGFAGAGTFIQSGGDNTIDGSIYSELDIGQYSGANGKYSLTAGTLSVSQAEYIGESGNGTFIQTGGTNMSGDFYVAESTGSSGIYSLSGSGSLTALIETIAGAGSGTFIQTGGVNDATGALYIGSENGANGIYLLSGGVANITNGADVGGLNGTAGGTGVLTISGTGNMNVTGGLTVFNTSGTSLNLEGGTLTTDTLNLSANLSLLNWTGGTLNLTAESVTLVNSSSGNLGPSGSLTLASGQVLGVTGYEYIGFDGAGTLNQSGGNNGINQGEYGSYNLLVGYGSDATGTYTLSSGALSVEGGNEYIGSSGGSGTFIQSGGSNRIFGGGEVAIAYDSASTGNYTLSGGTLTAGNVYVGGYDSGAGGSGTLAVSGTGSLNVSNAITVYATSGTAMNVSGGTISAPVLNLSGSYSQSAGVATFGQITGSGNIALSGGKLALNTDVNSTAATLTSSGSATLGFDIGSSASSELVLTTAIFNSTPTLDFTLSGFPSSGTQYTILSATDLSDNGFLNNLSAQQETIDGETLTPSFTGGGGGAGQIILTVTGAPALNLTWTGSDGPSWDNGATPNWRGASSTFAAGANVTFDDSASSFTVDINSGNVSPASVTFDNNFNAYTVNGTNAIAGSAGVTFEGSNTVTLNNNNTYTGATTLSGGGTVVLNGTNASPTFNVSDGTLVMGGNNLLTGNPVVNLGNGSTAGTLDLDGSSTTIGGLTGSSGFATVTNNQPFTTATLTVSGGNSTFNGTIQDGNGGQNPVALNLSSGSLTLTNNNPYSGGTTITGGTLTVSNTSGSATGSGNVTLNGGVLASGPVGTIAGNILAGSGPHTIAPGGIGSIGTLSVGGLTTSNQTTLSFQLGTGSGTITNGSELIFTGSASSVSIGGNTNLSFTNSPTAGNDYQLIGDTSSGTVVSTVPLQNFSLPQAPSGEAYSLGVAGDFIDLIVTSTGPTPIFWDNAGAPPPVSNGTSWDTSNLNWNSGSSGATYADGDAVTFNDTNNGHYQVTLSTTVKPASVTVSSSGNYSITGAGTIIDTGSFTKSGSGTLTLGTGLTASSLTIGSGKLALATNTTLGTGSTPGPVVSNINISSLNITLAGALDITNNHILIDYTTSDPIATIQRYLSDGYNNGHWNGIGAAIISSAAALNSHYGIGWADGGDGTHAVSGLLGGEIELKYTLLGDANLDGTVNGSDFSILAANFGLGHTNWDQGNFLYGSSVNGSDFSALAANFGQGDSGAAVAVSPADIAALDAFAVANNLPLPTIDAVPEPASASLLAIGSLALLRRARRRSMARQTQPTNTEWK
jgi:autotransporter-associated beta strand protein